MNNADFIANCVVGKYNGSKAYGNLWFDGKHVYSYGEHYPLLVSVGDSWIVNISGYSNTTSKHIGIANRHADYRMELGREVTLPELQTRATANLREYRDALNSLSTRAWKQREIITEKIGVAMRVKGFLDRMVHAEQGAKIEELTF